MKKPSGKLKMGFHESVVPEVFDGKICTWRIRDHKLKKGDIVDFENSQTGEIFGTGKITKVVKTTVGKIDLQDKAHYKTYKTRQELIKAFKRHNPDRKINNQTLVFAYTYIFTPKTKMKNRSKIYFAGSVRGGRGDVALYQEIIKELSRFGKVLTEHIGNSAISQAGESLPKKEIYKRDIDWLKQADVIVAECTTPSLGVGLEIGLAQIMQKPILCLYRPKNDKKLSAMIAGNPDIIVKNYQNVSDLAPIFQEFFEDLKRCQ